MARGRVVGLGVFVMVVALVSPAAAQLAPGSAAAPDGADLYKRSCAQCHDAGVGRAPNRDQFRSMTPDRVVAAMETGSMITMATNRTPAERRAIAEFLTGQTFATAFSSTPAPRAMCTGSNTAFDPGPDPAWNGW
jgi:polyvinyl alcohol dehydrogenase (cytochrome)